MVSKRIDAKARAMVTDAGITGPYVDVRLIAKKLEIQVVPAELGSTTSGVLKISKGVATIGYNPSETTERQRFTIGHELGHHALHRHEWDLFVDSIHFRDSSSTEGEELKEREANAYAAALLMPADFVNNEIMKLDDTLRRDDVITHLAKVFKVSTTAMAFRVANLRLIN